MDSSVLGNVDVWDARDMTDAQRMVVAELLCEIWPKPGRTPAARVESMRANAEAFAGPEHQAPRSFVIFDGPHLIAHAAIINRTIGTEQGDLTVAGLAQVCTDPAWRGCGLGDRIVRAALAPVDEGAFLISLFQTTETVQPFYERLGARRVENHFYNSLEDDRPDSPWTDSVQMIYPGSVDWPDGPVDLRGPGY